MKTFKEFMVIAEGISDMSDADFERWVESNRGRGTAAIEAARRRRAQKIKEKTVKTPGFSQRIKDFVDNLKNRPKKPSGGPTPQGQPFNPTGRPGSPGNSQTGYATNRGSGRQPPGGQPPGGQPPRVKPPTPEVKPPGRMGRMARGLGGFALRTGAFTAADIGADVAIDQIKNPTTRERVRGAKDLAMFAATPVLSSTLGIQGSSAPSGVRDVGPYRIVKRIDTSEPGSGFDRFLATGRNKAGFTYNDPNAEKIMAYRRDRVGSGKPEDKPFRVGAAKLGGQIVPVEYGSVAGQRKVGTQAQAASTRGVQQSRQVASKANVYGATKGSGIVGTGGPTTFNKAANTITTGGKTAQLPKTQILPGGRVGDLAYRGGKATYLARASVASRDTNVLSRLSRATGIGGQRERDAAASNRERQQAMQNTLRYRQQLGITGTGFSKPPTKPKK